MIGASAIASAALVVAAAERAGEGLYLTWRPQLERSLSRSLGQPVHLGPYRGLRPWGLSVGPSRISPDHDSFSSVLLRRLEVRVAPLASLRQGLLSLELQGHQASADLGPNRQGQYWLLGQRRADLEPPRLALRLRLVEPAQIRLAPSGQRWSLAGELAMQLQQRRLNLRSTLTPQPGGSHGQINLQLAGHWKRQDWRLRLGLNRLSLESLRGLRGRVSGDLALQWQRGLPRCSGRLQLADVLWSQPGQPQQTSFGVPQARLHCRDQSLTLAPTVLRWGSAQASISGRARYRPQQPLSLEALELRRGRSWLRSSGALGQTLALQGRFALHASDLPGTQRLPPWLSQAPLRGSFTSKANWSEPQLSVQISEAHAPWIGRWQASLLWRRGVLQLQQLQATALTASGHMPLSQRAGQGLRAGALQLRLRLDDLALERLSPWVGNRLQGRLQAEGTITGPLQRLVPDLQLQLSDVGIGPVSLQERWQGQLQGAATGGGLLQLRSQTPAPDGRLQATFNNRWRLSQLTLRRGAGQLSLQGRPRHYRWSASNLLSDGLIVQLGQLGPQAIGGQLSGQGVVGLQPWQLQGNLQLERPLLLGLRLQRAQLNGRYGDGRYQLDGTLKLRGQGSLGSTARGRRQGPFAVETRVRNLDGDHLRQLADLWSLWRATRLPARGAARDLGTLMLETFGQSLEAQLATLRQARLSAARSNRATPLKALQARLDADLKLEGPDLRRARLDLAAKGHLWTSGESSDRALASEPFTARLQGPLQLGRGNFNVQQLPLALLSLLTPVPEGLRGSLNIDGRYRLGRRDQELALQLGSQQAQWGDTPLELKRGSVVLAGQVLNLDLALQARGAQNNVELAGVLPLDPRSRKLELRLASRGDGLRFLTTVAEPDLSWQRGDLNLQLLLRGSLADPIANGFLRVKDGQLQALNQTLQDLEATVVFDFEQLLVQQLSAKAGERGSIQASGHLGLLEPTTSEPPLQVELNSIGFNLPRIQAIANGRLTIRGSLRDMQMGGDVAIDHGSINAQPGRLKPARGKAAQEPPRKGVSQLLQENWSFAEPLLLLGSEVETNSSQRVLQSVPRFAALGFDALRLKLGPNLRIVIPNAASFKTAGQLTLSGRLDPSLRARGVVRLLQGRLNLFTTSFSLDPEAPNVAIFTPALGLIPYLDIAMRTRVADNLATTGLGRAGTPSLAELEAQGGLTSLNQLNLVRITVSVEGPADRLAQSLRLRSSPPMPESRLIALIGGNSLAGLGGSGAGAAIATVLGQTLLSPVLSGLSDAMGQRLSFALYPTYVNPNVTNSAVLQSQRLAPQLVLGSEVGVDITNRLNASVLAAPNRSDVPPQLNLNVRATDLINIQGSVDTQGAWQTQLQLFFRF